MGTSEVVATQAPSDREPVTLTISHVWNGTRIPLMKAQLKAFEEQYPGIKVEHIVSTNTNFERELVAIAAGTSTGVLMVDRIRIPEFVESGVSSRSPTYQARRPESNHILQGRTPGLPVPGENLDAAYAA